MVILVLDKSVWLEGVLQASKSHATDLTNTMCSSAPFSFLQRRCLRCVYWYGDVTKEDLQAAIRMVLELKPIKEITVLEATRIFVEVLMSFRCSQTVCGFSASDSCFKMMPLKSLEQQLR